MPEYEAAFKKAFPDDKDPVTFDNVGKAIGAFERTLRHAVRWDKYLGGDKAALTPRRSSRASRPSRHRLPDLPRGRRLGGSMYQKLGLVEALARHEGSGPLRGDEAGRRQDDVQGPVLRNVEKTAPYFHDGSQATLEDAIKSMAEHQLGKQLDDDQVKSHRHLPKTLTGEPPGGRTSKAPELPKSTAKTPKPNPN